MKVLFLVITLVLMETCFQICGSVSVLQEAALLW
jgi:hypothetical protein